MQAVMDEGVITGSAAVDLTGIEPKYQLRGQLKNLSWQGGTVDLSGKFSAIGTGLDFVLGLQGEGSFLARSLTVLPETPITSATGSYVFAVSRQGDPKIILTSVQ